jgi:5-methylcytosine-specific restriction endonuclease McrA
MPRINPIAYKAYMKDYHANYDKQYYQDNKEKIKEQKAVRRKKLIRWFREEIKAKLHCAQCPEDFWACIEFHHTDPDEKEFALSDLVSKGFGKERILAEIEKCIVLCSNCHRKEHFNRA